MINKTVWIDHQHAYIFEFNKNKIIEKTFNKKLDLVVSDSPRKFTHAKEHQKNFYHLIANELGVPNKLLLLGPGVAREEFKHHCEFHHHEELAKHIALSIPMKSHPRRSEIIRISKDFFKDNLIQH